MISSKGAMMPIRSIITFIALGFVGIFANGSIAQSGLDTAFNNGGKVTTSFGTSASWINDSVLQPDGKIVAAGGYGNRNTASGILNKIALARYNADGTLDTSFGDNGKVLTNAVTNRSSEAMSIALRPDGKMVVVASVSGNAKANLAALLIYNSDGSPDTAFDGDGILTTSLPGSPVPYDIVIQSDLKMIVVCQAWIPGSGSVLMTARFFQTGTLDTGLGGDWLYNLCHWRRSRQYRAGPYRSQAQRQDRGNGHRSSKSGNTI